MGKLLVLAVCCSMLAVSQARQEDLDRNLLAFQGKPRQGHIEALKDNYVKQLFSQLLGRKLSLKARKVSVRNEQPLHVGLSRLEDPNISDSAPAPAMHEALLLHRELQSRLGWGSDDNGDNKAGKNQYGPPQGFSPPSQQYGPPPQQNQQYGPPPPPPNQQYGPPPNQQYGPPPSPPKQQYGPPPPPPNQQYGPPPPPPNQQYGPPAQPNQQYGPPPSPPNQQYGPPPPPPNEQYGPPPSPPNEQYGPPAQPNQQYGPPPSPPNEQYGPPPSPPNEQYGPPAQPNQQYGPPPSPPNEQYGPPAQPNQQYGPPSSNSITDSGKNHIRVNQGTFGGHVENFKLSDAVTKNNNNGYSPPPQNQYGPPSSNDISSFSGDSGSSDNAKIFKHVYIHTPPAEPEVHQQPRVIRPNKKQDTHYQIIFVKAPAPPQQPPTEIELPSPPERKTLVYVLVKKPGKPAEIKFKTPKPTNPPKPEVYFIRYKGNQKNGGYSGGGDQLPDFPAVRDQLPDYPAVRDFGTDISVKANDGYSNSIDSQPQIHGGALEQDAPLSGIISNSIKDSVGYPNTEYRATPNMLNPNQEPMSIAVYDRVRNGVMPASNSADRGSSLVAASSNVNARVARRRQGSHYTAPGSKPFERASGKMVDGQYVGMTSNVLNRQYYSENRRILYE